MISELEQPMDMVFTPAGLDIRKSPPPAHFSADATAWEQDDTLYEQAQTRFQLYENPLQLLHADTERNISALARFVTSSSDATLLVLELTKLTLDAYSPSFPTLHLAPDLRWETLGFDVCDINGFFSALNMNVFGRDPMPLFPENRMLEAFAFAEAANVKVPAHRPFVVVRLKRLLAELNG